MLRAARQEPRLAGESGAAARHGGPPPILKLLPENGRIVFGPGLLFDGKNLAKRTEYGHEQGALEGHLDHLPGRRMNA